MADRADEQPGTSLIREGMNRAIAAGTAAIFMTEEGVRYLVGDMKLPKDIVRYVTEQAAEGRAEFFSMLRHEVRRFFDRYEPNVELRRLLTENAIDIQARIRFVPESDGRLGVDVEQGTATAVGPDTRRRAKKAATSKPEGAAGKANKKKRATRTSKKKTAKKKRGAAKKTGRRAQSAKSRKAGSRKKGRR